MRKYRRFYAPVLVWLGAPLLELLDAGVRVLPQREWEERERQMYSRLYGTSIRIENDGTLVLPCFAGRSLAALLDLPDLEARVRTWAIERAAAALADLHRQGVTHADAMAENVVVDLDAGVARWLDFETTHDSARPMSWRRADDVRTLLMTCLARTDPGKYAETLALIRTGYADEAIAPDLARSVTTVWRRSLVFHLAQAPLSFQCFREIARVLRNADLSRSSGGSHRLLTLP